MRADIQYQENYSRGELLLRSFFGLFYIAFPHGFLLFFYGIWGAIIQFLTFWVILFTGSFPQNWFSYQERLQRWNWRVNARLLNMSDGYPAFGLDAEDQHTVYEVPYHENPDRISVLLRAFFGFMYVLIPHGFVLFFLGIVVNIFAFIAWWVVLFTGTYPKSMFDFNLKVLRWSARINIFMSYMTDRYPPFSLEGYSSDGDQGEQVEDEDNNGNDGNDLENNDYKRSDLV